MNRTTLFPSLDLTLPIGKRVEVLICFPCPTHLGCFAGIIQKKIISNRKRIVKKKLTLFTERKAL